MPLLLGGGTTESIIIVIVCKNLVDAALRSNWDERNGSDQHQLAINYPDSRNQANDTETEVLTHGVWIRYVFGGPNNTVDG